ncbi:hypothetical protein FC74_GL002271 [Lacticaseibacillus paracasei subsp. paracasei ATCC 25302 = DSM 5622 = JCM 8130]|nr:hypothetical protein FC74_GL002271 [Lacticaseibacillus paracasei subsp. paracasei ATCC 25302 = DSM 5622 = JCM 8130]
MLGVDQLAFGPDGELVSIYSDGPDFSNDSEVLMGEKPDLNDAVLMEYTGLHDKNGREIYDSDILKVTGEDGESYVATVKWFGDEDYPAFDLEGIPAAWNYDANALATIFQSGVETCEVIGNIFENPELLEGKQ